MKNILKNKLMQMFISGFEASNYKDDENFCNALKNNLGGVIFFSRNFSTVKQLQKDIKEITAKTENFPFISVDQEGGLVERTISLDKKNNYLTQKAASKLSKADFEAHYDILCKELKYLGFNMNFAPCVDVDTNKDSPIIGFRAFSSKSETVSKNTKAIINIMKNNNIINVAKHFPGHGECNIDSHKSMPVVSGDFNRFYDIHIKPFKTCIENNVDCIMVGHIKCEFENFLNSNNLPATLSKNVIDYLKNHLEFNGLIISDDMVMGGVSKYFSLQDSIIKGIFAGIEIFIFKDTTKELLQAVDNIAQTALTNENLKNIIERNFNKIIKFKAEKIKENTNNNDFDYKSTQKIINELAKKSISILNKDKLSDFKTEKKYYIVRFNPKEIYNLSFDNFRFSDVMKNYVEDEIFYSQNPSKEEISAVLKQIEKDIPVIFVTYNLHQNENQKILLDKIQNKKIILSTGNEYETEYLKKEDLIISTVCPKPCSLISSAEIITKNIAEISD